MVRMRAAIGVVIMVGFSFMLFLIHSPKALPLSALILVPLGVCLVWLATGSQRIDLVPLVRGLKGWKAALAVGVSWLVLLYVAACLWWLFRTPR